MPSRELLPFNPQLGEVGSWTRTPDGAVGQVWALHDEKARVWIADGDRYIVMDCADLAHPVDQAEQDGLFGDAS